MYQAFVSGGADQPMLARLLAVGMRLRVLVRSGAEAAGLSAGAEPVFGDLFNPGQMHAAMRGCEVVVHPTRTMPVRARAEGTRSLLAAARAAGVSRFVLLDGVEVYGDHGDTVIRENTPVDPAAPDARLEQLVRAQRSCGAVVLRCGGCWPDPALLDRARTGDLRLAGTGQQYRSLVHPDDAAQAVVLAITRAPDGSSLNTVDDEPVREVDFYQAVVRHAGGDPADLIPAGPAAPSRRCSNEALRRLGFTPAYPSYRDSLRESTLVSP